MVRVLASHAVIVIAVNALEGRSLGRTSGVQHKSVTQVIFPDTIDIHTRCSAIHRNPGLGHEALILGDFFLCQGLKILKMISAAVDLLWNDISR